MQRTYHEDVVGSFVVYDPTGRDLHSAMEVGRVIAVTWNSDDDGDAAGHPRPLLAVQPNGTDSADAVISVSVVEAILPREEISRPAFTLHPNEDGLDHPDEDYIR